MSFQEHDIEWSEEKIARMWNFYQHATSVPDMYFGLQNGRHVAHLLQKKAGLSKAKRIIDLSCGRGDIIAACMPHLKGEQKIFGTDLSEESVKTVNDRFEGNPLFGGATYADSFRTSFPDGYFDVVVSTEVVEHLNDEDLDSMLVEARRLLAPGGYIFITTPNNEDYIGNRVICPDCGCKFHRWQHIRSWSEKTLARRMQEAGFTTKILSPVAWAATKLKRVVFAIAAAFNLKERSGLFYIGQKRSA